MVNLSFLERINILLDTIKNSELAKYVIPGLFLLGIILIFFTRSKKLFIKIISSIIFLSIIGVSFYYFSNPILNFFDYLVEVVVNNILFPNLALYIFTIFIMDITLLVSILSNKMSNFIKTINILFFTLLQVILFFVVQNVIKNNINVYETLSVYTNQELLVLIETSMIIFGLWLIFILLVRLTKLLVKDKKTSVKEEKVNKENYNNSVVLDYNEIMQEDNFIEYVPIKKKRV